jgi:carbon-monoxide dehydrogenase medium subunit
MKAPAFDYARPASLDEVFALMEAHGDDARLLAGGQTLLATLNMRLSEPALLIDIGALDALRGITVSDDTLPRTLKIGALVTHREIEESPAIAKHAPLLAMAAPHIAHRAIRNRGTFGGSIAYGDPAAEWPVCLAALGGTVVTVSARGERRIPVEEFFIDLYTTALRGDELVAACEFPVASDADAFVFDELARRHGDYAIVGLAVAARFAGDRVERIRLAFLGAGSTPVRAVEAEALLVGHALDVASIERAVAQVRAELDPPGDLVNGGATKLYLASVLAQRALASLAARTS